VIRKLPQIIIQQIAAGEVVERPASVLKELVENSIDAQASQIKVDYQEGGIRCLRVSDDGVGIEESDVPMVFESHATSKLQKLEDFDHLQSMGFRGEAMSSISAVSKVSLWSCARSASVGVRAVMEHGHWRGLVAADGRVGTEVLVEDLFERLPVRSKFLKSAVAEARALQSTLKRIALAYPEIEFSLTESGKSVKFHWSKQNQFERVLEFFESTDAEHWMQGESKASDRTHGKWRVRFVFLRPRYFQSSRQNLQIYLNKRMIKDRKIEFAVRRAFEGYTETPGLSTGALFIEGDPALFDVNVHPTKMEIRFKDPEAVFSAVVHALRDHLEVMHFSDVQNVKFGQPSESLPSLRASLSLSSHRVGASESFQSEQVLQPVIAEAAQATQIPMGFTESWEYLGSVDATYWVVKMRGELFLFDQHALHERILYEDLWHQFQAKGRLSSQRLLFPIDLKFDQPERLEEQRDFLESLGFDWLQNSKSQWKLVATPSLLKRNSVELLRELLKGIEGGKEALLRNLLSTMACHSAIRAGDSVSVSQTLELLEKFKSEDALGHCPHGRPTFVKLSSGELEKLFHRV
jgi:DNA mismatch repair protein MutL